ncbi:hypothetical protein [Pseudoflavitalea rhizosphaerae]|uniref:hypothetical protein n=1 Tax=Pseudoflavitalea rhizosphaerae TaxID=1884793 RepID=UPI000F8C9F78|nr:hypothetical protein [Pseudoflavitalea rhizosphaerae]
MKRFIFFLLIGIGISASAQDLTGIWRGNFKGEQARYLEALGQESRYKIELQVDQSAKAFKGVTYSYLTTVFYGKATCRGTVNPSTGKVFLEELKIVEVRMSGRSDACIMTYFLQYSKIGNEEFLEGSYSSMNTTDSTSCGRGRVFLRKVQTSDFYKEPFLLKKEAEKKPPIVKAAPAKPAPKSNPAAKPNTGTAKTTTTTKSSGTKKSTPTTSSNTTKKTQQPVVKPATPQPLTSLPPQPKLDTIKKVDVKPRITLPTPKVISGRQNELVQTITTDARKLIINIYDNGTIDNDTISVYHNKKLVLSKKRLTDKPLTIEIELSEEDDLHELVMVAENLGEFPPNTSLMVVNAGKKYYEVRITSTEQKNAVVVFKYEKPK